MPEAMFLSDLPEHERHDPGDEHLKAQAVKYERENHRRDYRQMKADGELDEYAPAEGEGDPFICGNPNQPGANYPATPGVAQCGSTSLNERRIDRCGGITLACVG